MKNIITLAIALLSLSSCNAKDEIKVDKTTLIWSQVEPLPDYSYKGYQIEPYTNYRYKMPIEIGSEWLVLYSTEESKKSILNLKPYIIQDSISISLITENSVRLYSSPYPINSSEDSIVVPIFNIPDIILSEPRKIIFFKGFDKYNTNFASDFINHKFSDYNIYIEGEDNDSIIIDYYTFKYNAKTFSLQDTYLKSSIDKKEYVHYIFFRKGDQYQCLIYRIYDREILNPIEYSDLDGDGLPDLIFNLNYEIKTINENSETYSNYSSYLLYLSSEAEEGELVKHVATKTFLNKKRTFPITK